MTRSLVEPNSKRLRFLGAISPTVAEAVEHLNKLTQLADPDKFEYTREEALEVFNSVEQAAGTLWMAYGLDEPLTPLPALSVSSDTVTQLSETRYAYTLARSKIDRAMVYLHQGNIRDAKTCLRSALKVSDDTAAGSDISA